MTHHEEKEVRAALNDIDKGICTVLERVDGIERRVDTNEGQLIHVSEYLRERKLGLGVSLPGVNEGRDQFKLSKAVVGIGMKALGQDVWREIKAEYEHAVLTEATTKALDTGTAGSGGGYIVPLQALTEFIGLLYANTTVIAAGARVLPDLIGSPVYVPRQLTSANVGWIGQNPTGGIPKSEPSFGNIVLTPKTMAARAQYSNLLAILSNPNIEQIIRNDFARIAALELDRVVLRGGALSEPVGLANMAQIPTLALGTDGDYFDWNTAVECEGMLEDANALVPGGKFGFVLPPVVKRRLKMTRIPQWQGDTGGTYVVPPVISDRQLAEMLGYPFFTTTQIPKNLMKNAGTNLTEVYFANWADVLIGMWGGLEILASNIAGDAWSQNAVEVRLIQNVEVQLRNLASVCYINDAKTI